MVPQSCPDVFPELWGQAAPASQASVPLCPPGTPGVAGSEFPFVL